MFLQHTKWSFIFTIIKVYLILHIIYILIKSIKGYLEHHGILQKFSVKKMKNLLIYPRILIYHYKNDTPECPALCAAFQTAIGFCRLYGKDGLFKANIMFKPVVAFFRAEVVEVLLGNTELIDKSNEYKLTKRLFGDGLITSQRTKWRIHRKLLTPTFHFSILEDCIPIFQEKTNVLISKIQLRIQEPWIDVMSLLTLCSLDIICQTAMGVSMNIQIGGNRDYSNAILRMEETIMYRALRPWLYNDFIFNLTKLGKKFNSDCRLVYELHEKIVRQKMNEMTNKDSTLDSSNKYLPGKKMRKPFLELLLEHHLKDSSFTEKHVRDEVDTFMYAGHDTTSKTASWVLYCLGIYPDIQRKVQEELDEIFTNEENVNISREILSKMKYLECVIKETLRIYPTVLVFARENKEPFKVLNYNLKKGTLCIVSVWELHRDPAIFRDPEKFIPERFLPENCSGRHPYAFIPFSAGPRNCIGQKFAMLELKTILACVLRHFRVKSLDPRDKVLIYPNITIGNAHPLRLKFEHR